MQRWKLREPTEVDADYSIELGPTAPALEMPWSDPEGKLQYVDLRIAPRDVDRIPEVRNHLGLRSFLIAVNSHESPWQSAKCDLWAEQVESATNLYGAAFSQNCYVDLVLADPSEQLKTNLEVHKALAKQIAQELEEHEELPASAEIVVRRCYFHRPEAETADDSTSGYCLTLYLSGFGASTEEAYAHWSEALELAGRFLLKTHPQEARAQDSELG